MRPTAPTFLCLLILASVLLASCGPATVSQLASERNAKQLNAGEILLMAKGNTLFIHGSKVNTYLYFDESGYIYGKDIYEYKDSGLWDVSEGGELCIKMNHWWLRNLRCYPVYRDESKYYLVNSAGVLEFTAEHLAGDTKNLYYAIKKSKKSFLMEQKGQESALSASAENEKPVEQVISEDSGSSGGPTEEELQSTVKWMARDCPGCKLAGSDLAGAELIGAKLQGADLSGANLSRSNLRRADLSEADLEGADLTQANLPGANLRDSDLSNADLRGANLIKADLTGAKTDGADFEGALLEGAVGLRQ